MNKTQLIDAICAEEERVWGPEGINPGPRELRWFEEHYGISEKEDSIWRLIVMYECDQLPPLFASDPALVQSMEDTFSTIMFLEGLLRKYQSSRDVYPRAR